MKIRKGFVTNSSSYSSVYLTIRNKTLIEILKKYEFAKIFIGGKEDIFSYDESESGARFNLSGNLLNFYEDLISDLTYLIESNSDDVDHNSIKHLQEELKQNINNLIYDTQEIRYDFNDAHSGDQYNKYDEIFYKLYPGKNIDDFDSKTFYETYTFEIIEGKVIKKYDFSLEIE